MKKIVYFISVLLTCSCLNRDARAFAWPDLTPLIPFSPQFCVMCIPPAIAWAYDTIGQIPEAKRRLKEMTDVTKIKQKLTAYALKMGNTALNKYGSEWGNAALNSLSQKLSLKRKVASASRAIMESKREGVDIRSEDSIKTDFVNLFLQYPSDKSKIRNAYKKKGNELKIDMALEMYIAASEMYKDLCGEKGEGCKISASLGDNPNELDASADLSNDSKHGGMMLQLSMIESCFMEGKFCEVIQMQGCEPSKDSESTSSDNTEQPTESDSGDEDKICHWKAALEAANAYDKIMRDSEYLIQMQHQYEAVMGIDTLAKIKRAEEKQTDKIVKGLEEIGDTLNIKTSQCQECMLKNGSMAGCASVCM